MSRLHLDEVSAYNQDTSQIVNNLMNNPLGSINISTTTKPTKSHNDVSTLSSIIDKSFRNFDSIPGSDRSRIIEDYPTSKYNYYVDGDRLYHSRKGINRWVDISDNRQAYDNVVEHLKNTNQTYKMNDDQHLNTTSDTLKTGIKNKNKPVATRVSTITDKRNLPDALKRYMIIDGKVENNTKQHKNKNNFKSFNDVYKTFINPNNFTGDKAIDLIRNYKEDTLWNRNNVDKEDDRQDKREKKNHKIGFFGKIRRLYQKINGKDNKVSLKTVNSIQPTDSEYSIIPESYTGDTVWVDKKGRYILPESLNVSEMRFGSRTRGDYNPINSSNAPITTFWEPLPKYKTKQPSDSTSGYIGITADGKFKAGFYNDFDDNDIITRAPVNDVAKIHVDEYIKPKGNPTRYSPVTTLADGRKGSLSVLTSTGKKDPDTYGKVAGGRYIIKVGNETRLVSGSINNINNEFEAMKERNNETHGLIFTLDNGTYNTGLRVANRTITSDDLKNYDKQHKGGGHFFYELQTPGYDSDTVYTPNIEQNENKPLRNKQQGVLLHYTAYNDGNDLTNVTKRLTNPNSKTSAHVIIAPNGNRRILADSDKITWHAGESRFKNVNNVNDFMVGVEFQNPGDKPLTEQQIDSFINYVAPIIRKNNIPLEHIVTHKTVRDNYIEYLKANKDKSVKDVQTKADLTYEQYKQILTRLIGTLYSKKKKETI